MNPDSLVLDRPDEGIFRVHRSTMTSPQYFELERQRIFNRSWLYVGHESELEHPGDYRRRKIAGRPVFLARGSDGQVRIFLNTCTHRGAMVCRKDEGNAETFQCFYHAWTFNNRGELVGTPDQSGYAEGFDRAERSLQPPPRVESYRGMYFASFDPEIESLCDYLGGAREYIDLTLDSAEVLGGWAVIAGTAKYAIRANWKLLIENSVDHYHLPTVHQTYLEYTAHKRERAGVPMSQDERRRRVSKGMALDRGHVCTVHGSTGRAIANPSPIWSEETRSEIQRVKDLLIERFGDERARQMAETSRFLSIFPNLIFQDTQSGFRLRQVWPLAPDLMEVTQWELVPREERKDVRANRMEASLMFLGPGGLATPDDVEALESCQLGFEATEVQWSDLSRGMHRDPTGEDEIQMRGFWRQWHALVRGLPGPETTGDRSPSHQAMLTPA